MSVISNYYNKKIIPYSMGARRKRKTMPLLIDVHKKRILDVGCASGYIGETLRRQGNYVVGIDIVKKDIAKAKKVLNKAYIFDIETDNTKILGENYDLIIMVEVMEHLFDPEEAVKRFLPLLKPGGQILLSTPNVVHLYIRLKFLLGIFEYQEETVINKSHIHFFTRPTFIKMIRKLDLEIVKENDVVLPETVGFILKIWPSLFAHQMVAVCRKSDTFNNEV